MRIEIPAYTAEILARLECRGYEAYIVGGCVRDNLLGRTPDDWDVATNAKPYEVKACFPEYHVVETGLRHGTLTVVIDKIPTEITTYRLDGNYSDFRRPDSVDFTDSLRADLSRRDFTVNALAYHPEKGLVDYFGGLDDITARRIVCVGDADARFSEDALRILRAVRFASALGFSIEEKTRAAILRLTPLLDRISEERVAIELNKALMGEHIAEQMLDYTAVFTRIIPELIPEIGFDQRTPYHHLDVWRHTVEAVREAPRELVLRLTMLLHDIGKPKTFSVDERGVGHFYGHVKVGAVIADQVLRRLKYDANTRKTAVRLIELHCNRLDPEPRHIKRALNRLGEDMLRQLFQIKRADSRARSPKYQEECERGLDRAQRVLDEIIRQGQAFCLKDLAINGDDLLKAGFEPGKKLGDTLATLLERVIDESLPNEREALLMEAGRLR